MRHSSVDEQTWEMLGKTDPLWAVLTCPSKRYGQWDKADFYSTGQRWVDELMQQVHDASILSQFDRVMDFGCGPGRLTRYLASYFEDCVGIDISQSMIELARIENLTYANCQFVYNTQPNLKRWLSNSFDMVVSQMTLQHMSTPAQIEAFITEFLRVVKPDGLIVFQLPERVSWFQPETWVFKGLLGLGFSPQWLYQQARLRPIGMTGVPPGHVIRWVEAAGGQVIHREVDYSAGAEVPGYRYWVKKPAVSD